MIEIMIVRTVVKIDGEYFRVPKGYLETLEIPLVGRINYRELKTGIKARGRKTPIIQTNQILGYYDFDMMETLGEREPQYVGTPRQVNP